MSRITRRFAQKTSHAIPNSQTTEGYPAFEKNPKTAYLQMLMTNVLGNTYYASKEEQVVEAIGLHQLAIKQFPEFVGPAAVYARNKGFMRSQPVMAMAYLAHAKHSDFEKYFNQVILTPNDLSDFLTFFGTLRINKQGQPTQGGRMLKRVVGSWLSSKLNAYWVVKYGSESKSGYSLRDVLITIHPSNVPGYLANYIMRGTLPEFGVEDSRSLAGLEALKKADNQQDAILAVRGGRLPHEVVTPFCGQYPQLWDEVVPNMPIFALLRNLVTIARHTDINKHKDYILTTLTDPEKVAKSKILPFQFVKAFDEVEKNTGIPAWVSDAIRTAVDLSVSNIPAILASTKIGLDVSGSMAGKNLREGAILGIALARKSPDVDFVSFDDKLYRHKISKQDSILTQAAKFTDRGQTATSLVSFDMLEQAKAGIGKFDVCVLFTDEQQNTSAPFYGYIEDYRRRYNKNLKLFIVDVGPYAESGGLAPEGGLNYYIVGWSPKVLEFISLATEGFESMAQAIQQGKM